MSRQPISLDMDAVSLEALGLEGDEGIVWPVPLSAYTVWAFDFLQALTEIARQWSGTPDWAAFATVLPEIYRDASRVACAALDLDTCARGGQQAIVTPALSPVAAWLSDEAPPPERVATLLPDVAAWRPVSQDWKSPLRRLRNRLKGWVLPSARRVDVLQVNEMLLSYLGQSPRPRLFCRPQEALRPHDGTLSPSLRRLADAVTTAFQAQWARWDQGIAPGYQQRAEALFNAFLTDRLQQAALDIERLQGWFRHQRPARVLLGGAPKAIGRQLSWIYRNNGRQVFRFSHGGDRGFFDDTIWGISELFAADRYFVHGLAEMTTVSERLRQGRVPYLDDRSTLPVLHAYGASQQRDLFTACQTIRCTRTETPQRVMLVAGSFGAEFNHGTVAFKLPDVLAADLQAHLLRHLRRLGYEVLIKPHPGGLWRSNPERFAQFYRGLCDRIVTGPLVEAILEADVLLFEFAGSAWFDSLASDRGIVVIDAGNRPFDPGGEPLLKQRCVVLSCQSDQHHRLRVSEPTLQAAIEEAFIKRQACNTAFCDHLYSPLGTTDPDTLT